jgi:hypothetical protein
MSRSILPRMAAAIVFFAALTATADAVVDIHIDKTNQRMFVAVDGVTRYVWSVSTGAGGYDTPSGDFRPFRMERDHFSREWDNAPMPYSIFFTTEGHAIHGSNHTRSLGQPASHGCVRLAPHHARKLFELVSRTGLEEASVTISGAYASAAPALTGDDVAGSYASPSPPYTEDVSGPYASATAPPPANVVDATTVY